MNENLYSEIALALTSHWYHLYKEKKMLIVLDHQYANKHHKSKCFALFLSANTKNDPKRNLTHELEQNAKNIYQFVNGMKKKLLCLLTFKRR